MLDPSLLVFDARRGADVNPNPDDSSSNKLAESYDVVLARPRPSILDRVSVSEGSLPLVNNEGSRNEQKTVLCIVYEVLGYELLVLWLPCLAPSTR
jgi:hypothetical protein